MGFGFGSRARGGKGSFEQISKKSIVGIMGTNKAGDKAVCRFTFPIDNSNTTYVTLNVYTDMIYQINKGRNSGKMGMSGWLSMSRRVGGSSR